MGDEKSRLSGRSYSTSSLYEGVGAKSDLLRDTFASLKGPKEVQAEFLRTFKSLNDSKLNPKDKLDLLNKLASREFITNITTEQGFQLDSLVPTKEFLGRLRKFIVHPTKTLRTAALRVLRYYMKEEKYVKELVVLKIHVFISKCLEADKQSDSERIQALKLVRVIMTINSSLLTHNIVRSLVCIAEYPEDTLSRVAVETICELSIREPKLSAHCGGIRVLVNAILDPNNEAIQSSLVLAIDYLLDDVHTRQYIRPDMELGSLLGPLTDSYYNVKQTDKNSTKKELEDKQKVWKASLSAIKLLIKSWNGLIALASHPLGLRSIVNALSLPPSPLQGLVLDTLFDIFRIDPELKESNPFKTDPEAKVVQEEGAEEAIYLELPSRTRGEKQNVLKNYVSALLLCFIDHGLIEGLVAFGSRRAGMEHISDDKEHIKSTLLLAEILYLTNTMLPSGLCARVQTLPSLVNFAAAFELDPKLRSTASSMITNLQQYHHIKHTSSHYKLHLNLIVTATHKWKRIKGRDKRLDRMDEVKMKLDFAMDTDQLKNKIQESGVPASKDYDKWRWEIIADLIEGPFNNPALVLYACTKTKMIKRLLSFLRPYNYAFSKIPWSLSNLKYARISAQLLEVLVSNESTVSILMEDTLLSEIAEFFKNELECERSPTTVLPEMQQRFLTRANEVKLLAKEYFTLIGSLTGSARGLEILSKFNITQYLLELADLQSRPRFCHYIVNSLDYNRAGDSRVILGKALTSAATAIRFLATRHMKVLLRAGVQDFSDWGVELLVKQLYDDDSKVANEALKVLDEACDESDALDTLIKKKPPLLKLGTAGYNLLLRFLSRPLGFQYLKELKFTSEEMIKWREEKNVLYVQELENRLNDLLSQSQLPRDADQSMVLLPPHFYGELANTQEGAQLIAKSGDIESFVKALKSDVPTLQKKAALWALGHIGSAEHGYQLFEKYKITEMLIQLAETSTCLSIRGACYYVLGMISKHEAARKTMLALEWESPPSPHSFISVPRQPNSTFFKIPPCKYLGSFPVEAEIVLPVEENETRMEILRTVANMSNSISAEGASRSLKRLKAQNHDCFASPTLFVEVLNLLATYKFKLSVRRTIHEAFESVIWNDEAFSELEKIPCA